MHPDMDKQTKNQVLAKLRERYRRASKEYKSKILDDLQHLFGFHRKAAIRAVGSKPKPAPAAPALLGRPPLYAPEKLLPVLKPIWFTAQQPCGRRLAALLPEWLPAFETDHRRLDSDVRRALLAASAATLDRLLAPVRASVACASRCGTRPGSLLRQEIPVRDGPWDETQPGWLEVDTVALCGGCLDDRHGWMFDGVDIYSDWASLRALRNRGQQATLEQLQDIEAKLPFCWRGMDSDNGGEFLNWHVADWLRGRPHPVALSRSRPYRKNDNAHIEQRNYSRVRLWFGYERYDAPGVFDLINTLCRSALEPFLNHCLPTMKLAQKRREGSRVVRVYGAAQTPYARLLASAGVSGQQKAQLQTEHARFNPFQLERDIQRQLRVIEKNRRAPE
jgi:hypothetical protein